MKCLLGSVLLIASVASCSASDGAVGPIAASASSRAPKVAPPVTDSLIFTGEWNRTSNLNGEMASVDWLHIFTNRPTIFTAGVALHSVDGSRWTFAKIGGSFRSRPRLILDGSANLGGGTNNGLAFAYVVVGGHATYQVLPNLYLNAGSQYFHVAAEHGNLPHLGAMVLIRRRVSVEGGYSFSAGGNMETRFWLTRVALEGKHARIFSVVALGHSAPQVFDVGVGLAGPPAALRDFCLGTSIPVSRFELTTAWEFTRTGIVNRQSLTVSIKLPLRTREQPRP